MDEEDEGGPELPDDLMKEVERVVNLVYDDFEKGKEETLAIAELGPFGANDDMTVVFSMCFGLTMNAVLRRGKAEGISVLHVTHMAQEALTHWHKIYQESCMRIAAKNGD